MGGVYIHIPFCRSRCIYCDFYSTTLPQTWQMPYVEAVEKEMRTRLKAEAPTYPLYPASTLYIGGGTPSQLSREAFHHLFNAIDRHLALAKDTEVTIEANPDDVTPEWVAQLKDTPVNRISMGVQSMNDGILRTLRRRHTAEQARQAVELLQTNGYHDLSLDLIYGLPGQTLQQFEADVREVLDMGIPHLSAYALQFEEGTPLYAMRQQGTIREADEELSLACYERLIDLTAEAGMEHYEISNFARPDFRSRHNSSYWQGTPYIGLGAGAHSYDGNSMRCSNCEDVIAYIQAINKSKSPATIETLSDINRYNERIMLRLRTCEGLNLNALECDFGFDRHHYCERMALPHLGRGTLKKTGETLSLTRRGLFVSDDIISDLMFGE